jgi:hypothetical protein
MNRALTRTGHAGRSCAQDQCHPPTRNPRGSAVAGNTHGSFRMGTSLPFPHWNPAIVPVLEYPRYHVPFEGRKTARSVLPCPSAAADY